MRIRALLDQMRRDLCGDTERGRLMRSAGLIAAMKIGATLFAFAASLVYARALGPHDYGLYAYVIAWTAVLGIPASLGLPQYLVREGARFPQRIAWLCNWADRHVLFTGTITGCLLLAAFLIPQAAGARWLFIIAAPLPLLNNLVAVRVSLLQTQGRTVASLWPQLLFVPAITLTLLLGTWFWYGSISAKMLMSLMLFSTFVSLIITTVELKFPAIAPEHPEAASEKIRYALPFMWLGILYLINSRTDLIMLGSLKGAKEAGIYAIANRAAELVPFILVAANTVMAPLISRLYQQNDMPKLQRLLSAAAKRIFYSSLPVILAILIFAHPLLRYLYGDDFAAGAIALQILTCAQLINIAAGATGTILNMTGHERLSAAGVGLSAVLNVVLNAVLIPLQGIEGAAIATGVSLVSWNVLLWYWIRRRLNLRSTVFGI